LFYYMFSTAPVAFPMRNFYSCTYLYFSFHTIYELFPYSVTAIIRESISTACFFVVRSATTEEAPAFSASAGSTGSTSPAIAGARTGRRSIRAIVEAKRFGLTSTRAHQTERRDTEQPENALPRST